MVGLRLCSFGENGAEVMYPSLEVRLTTGAHAGLFRWSLQGSSTVKLLFSFQLINFLKKDTLRLCKYRFSSNCHSLMLASTGRSYL